MKYYIKIALSCLVILLLSILFKIIPGLISPPLAVKETVIMECGDPVTLTPGLFLNNGNSEGVTIESPLLNTPSLYTYIEQNNKVVSRNKSYLETGEYPITLNKNGTQYSSLLIITDTTRPTIDVISSNAEIPLGNTSFDFTSLVKIFDYDRLTVTINTDDLDFNTCGYYPVNITAEDASGNSNSITVYITVTNNSDTDVLEPDNNNVIQRGTTTNTQDIKNNSGSSDSNNPSINTEGPKNTQSSDNRQTPVRLFTDRKLDTLEQWEIDYYVAKGYEGVFSDGI